MSLLPPEHGAPPLAPDSPHDQPHGPPHGQPHDQALTRFKAQYAQGPPVAGLAPALRATLRASRNTIRLVVLVLPGGLGAVITVVGALLTPSHALGALGAGLACGATSALVALGCVLLVTALETSKRAAQGAFAARRYQRLRRQVLDPIHTTGGLSLPSDHEALGGQLSLTQAQHGQLAVHDPAEDDDDRSPSSGSPRAS